MAETDQDEHLQLIGEIARNASVLELMVANMVWDLLGAPDGRGQAVTYRMSMNPLIDLAERLLPLSDVSAEEQQEARAGLKWTRQLYERRSKFLHTAWGPMGAEAFMPISTRTAGSVPSERVSRRDMKDLAEDLMKCVGALATFSPVLEGVTIHAVEDDA